MKDEVDINKVINKYIRTGEITNRARGKPSFGDAPDQNYFEAACIGAEIASQDEIEKLAPQEPENTKEPETASEDVSDDPIPGEESLDPAEESNEGAEA